MAHREVDSIPERAQPIVKSATEDVRVEKPTFSLKAPSPAYRASVPVRQRKRAESSKGKGVRVRLRAATPKQADQPSARLTESAPRTRDAEAGSTYVDRLGADQSAGTHPAARIKEFKRFDRIPKVPWPESSRDTSGAGRVASDDVSAANPGTRGGRAAGNQRSLPVYSKTHASVAHETEVEFMESGLETAASWERLRTELSTWSASDAPSLTDKGQSKNSSGNQKHESLLRPERSTDPGEEYRINANARHSSAASVTLKKPTGFSKRDSDFQSSGITNSRGKAAARFETEQEGVAKVQSMPAFRVDQSDESPWPELPVQAAFDSTDELVAMERTANRLKKLEREQRGSAWNA
ncbi:MAG: hypothetical protein QOH96_1785 [Blastocatellia bacterium]|nr:hypothetical protein [Blastocatellia bacterium]